MKRFHCRRGFISIMAIVMLFVVSIALVTLATSFAGQVRRTRASSTGVQLRQFLLAAPALAHAELTARGVSTPSPRTLDIPLPLDQATLTLTFLEPLPDQSVAATETVTVLATARLRDAKASQRLTYRRTPTGWIFTAARLLPGT